MAWARLDDSFPEHPKVLRLSDAAFRAHVTAMCYAQRVNSRGVIRREALTLVGAKLKTASELEQAGIWDVHPDGWEIHDFLLYNPPRETALPDPLRKARAEAGRLGGLQSGAARRSKHEANDEAKSKQVASKQTKPHPIPYPDPPDDSLRSSSTPAPPDDADKRFGEYRDTVLSRLPARNQRDPLSWDEAESLARDYAARPGAMLELARATDDCRRERELPFPSNLRKHLPKLPAKLLDHPAKGQPAVVRVDFSALDERVSEEV